MALVWVLLTGVAHGADYKVSKPGRWVAPMEVDFSAEVPEGDISSGVYYLLLDRQVDKRGRKKKVVKDYRHQALKLVNQQGVEQNGSLSIDFDPAYQTLFLHKVVRHREGKVTNLLKTAESKLLHREEEMEYRIYNGMRTLNLIFKDIRVGDTLEYSYTVVGENPVFGGSLYRFFYLGWSVPVHTLRIRMTVPESEPLNHKMFNTEAQPELSISKGKKRLELNLAPVPGYRFANETPGWCDPYPAMQVSQAETWAEVATWADALHNKDRVLSAPLKDKIAAIEEAHADEAARIVAALEFVQDEIRYLGIEVGEGSYVPSDPSTVFSRRFGDCKDKSLLFCTMLKEMGIRAWPVLVNSWTQGDVGRRLPSPTVFNHVVSRVELDGETYWFDPTSTHERGSLAKRNQANYGQGLVVRKGEADFSAMGQPRRKAPDREVYMHFDLSDNAEESARLTVRTIMRYGIADEFRFSLEQKGRKGMGEHLRDFYTSSYPGLVVDRPFEVADDTKGNEITLKEHYIIDRFWDRDKEGQFTAGIYPREIGAYLNTPRVVNRKVPFGISHPVHIRLLTTCTLPTGWEVPNDALYRKNSAMVFDYKLTSAGNDLMLYYDYRSLSNSVKPEEIEGYMDDVAAIKAAMDYTISLAVEAPVARKAPLTLKDHLALGRDLAQVHGLYVLGGMGAGSLLTLLGMGVVMGWRRKRRLNRWAS